MRCLVAVDSFKGTASSRDAGDAIARGIKAADSDVEVRVVAVADGGEGTVEAFHLALGGELKSVPVHGPLFEERQAEVLVLEDGTAVMEMASAAGLPLVPPLLRNPMHTTTLGVGELIRAALYDGCRKLYIGLGGSATVDGGMGAATALGAAFLDADEKPVPLSGSGLGRVASIDMDGLDPALKDAEIIALSDVDNPLLGETGAAKVFGPQKGADDLAVDILEAGMKNLAGIVVATLGKDIADTFGGGAAGGLGFGLAAFLEARIVLGASAVLDAVRFDDALAWADVVITGEGRLDGQTSRGKAPEVVRQKAREAGKRVIAVAGSIDRQSGAGDGYDAVFSLVEIAGEEESLNNTLAALERLNPFS